MSTCLKLVSWVYVLEERSYFHRFIFNSGPRSERKKILLPCHIGNSLPASDSLPITSDVFELRSKIFMSAFHPPRYRFQLRPTCVRNTNAIFFPSGE